MLKAYKSATSKPEKGYILSVIVEKVRTKGGFIKMDTKTGQWYDVGDFLAREKVSQAFRDALSDKYKSSTAYKKKRREVEQTGQLFDDDSNPNADQGYSMMKTGTADSVPSSLSAPPQFAPTAVLSSTTHPLPMMMLSSSSLSNIPAPSSVVSVSLGLGHFPHHQPQQNAHSQPMLPPLAAAAATAVKTDCHNSKDSESSTESLFDLLDRSLDQPLTHPLSESDVLTHQHIHHHHEDDPFEPTPIGAGCHVGNSNNCNTSTSSTLQGFARNNDNNAGGGGSLTLEHLFHNAQNFAAKRNASNAPSLSSSMIETLEPNPIGSSGVAPTATDAAAAAGTGAADAGSNAIATTQASAPRPPLDMGDLLRMAAQQTLYKL